jgi:membrane protein DedA with SNARE-associated domain
LIGAGTMPFWEFAAANALGALLWAGFIGAIGYFAGHAVEQMLGQVAGAEKIALIAVLVIALLGFAVRALLRRRQADRG